MKIHRNLAVALITAGTYLGGAMAVKAAEHAGLFTHDVGVRAYGVFTGLVLAAYGNALPKTVGTFRTPMAAMRMQAVLRVGGWAFTLGGLAYAVASLLPVPTDVGPVLLAVATAYVMGYSGWAFMECDRGKSRPTA